MSARLHAVSDDARPAVEVHALRKTYPGGAEAVRGIDFQVAPGEVFGLLGPNGAGKSTTIGMLTTTIKPTSGSARSAGFDVVRHPIAARAVSSVVFQESVLDKALTGRRRVQLSERAVDVLLLPGRPGPQRGLAEAGYGRGGDQGADQRHHVRGQGRSPRQARMDEPLRHDGAGHVGDQLPAPLHRDMLEDHQVNRQRTQARPDGQGGVRHGCRARRDMHPAAGASITHRSIKCRGLNVYSRTGCES
jgi:ABC transporter